MIALTARANHDFLHHEMIASVHQDVVNEFVHRNAPTLQGKKVISTQHAPRAIDLIMQDKKNAAAAANSNKALHYFERKHKDNKKGFFRTYIDIWIEFERKRPIEYRVNYNLENSNDKSDNLSLSVTYLEDSLHNSRDNCSYKSNSRKQNKKRNTQKGNLSILDDITSQEITSQTSSKYSQATRGVRKEKRKTSTRHSPTHYDRNKHHHNHFAFGDSEMNKV